jgi:hypothetical protein
LGELSGTRLQHEELAKNPPLHIPELDSEISQEDKEFNEFAEILTNAACHEFGIKLPEKSPLDEFRERMGVK